MKNLLGTRIATEPSYRNIFIVALPALLAVGMEPMAELIDTALLGHKHVLWVAGLAATNAFFGSFAWVFNFLSYGVTARVAKAFGRKNETEIRQDIRAALILAAIFSFLVALALFPGQKFFMGWVLGASPEVSEASRAYWFVRAAGFPFEIISVAMIGVLRGLQQIRLGLIMVVLATATNLIISYFSLYVLKTGMVGAGVGTSLSFVVSTSFGFYWLLKNGFIDLRRSNQSLLTRQMVVQSTHIFGRTALLTLSFFLLSAVVTRFGALPLAAHQIALQLWLLCAYLIDGFAVTGTTLGGAYIGAGRFDLYRMLSYRLVGLGFIAGLTLSLLFFLGESFAIGIFTDDVALKSLVSSLIWIFILTTPFNAVLYVLDGLLFATQSFDRMFKVMAVSFLVFLPALGWASFVNSLQGVWLALALINIVRFIGQASYLRRDLFSECR